jgi:nitrate/TMAO reductase-like tetraheme cytochrome c subunit
VASSYSGTKPAVYCTTCHNQHIMNIVAVNNAATLPSGGPMTGLPSGYYATMFFVRAPYNPNTTTTGSNQTAQFCRQCHGGEANEKNASTAVTIF